MVTTSFEQLTCAAESSAHHVPEAGCADCGFALWLPIAALKVSRVGLYDDARFPGRLIVSLNDHVEHLDQADPGLMSDFIADLQRASLVLRKVGDVERVNIAVLGNKVPHLHAHVIPRRIADNNHGVSPWENAAPLKKLADEARIQLLGDLQHAFRQVGAQ
jgi:diadenosine tetraphosphate (Ap4A) HIT family hydrolase